MDQSRFTIALVALALAFPAAAAATTWSGDGAYEPNTVKDNPDYLWFDPPGSATDRVYFNAVPEEFPIGNTNLATTGMRTTPSPLLTYHALLGQWTDCNGDGYIGQAETALDEYPSQVLTATGATSLCPDGTAHNKGGWVTELLQIGINWNTGGIPNAQRDPRIIIDNTSMVWGDENLPDTPIPGGGNVCFINPPQHTFRTTGSFLNWADCFSGYRVLGTYDTLLDGGSTTAAGQSVPTPGIDPTNSQHLNFSDNTNWNQKDHPLNQPLFASDDSSHSVVYAQDCGSAPLAGAQEAAVHQALQANTPQQVKDETAQGVTPYKVVLGVFESGLPRAPPTNPVGQAPALSTEGPGDAVAGTFNETQAETRPDGTNCDHTKDPSNGAFYNDLQEAPVHTSAARAKTQPDYLFNFSTQQRGHFHSADNALPTVPVDVVANHPRCMGLDRFCHGELVTTGWGSGSIQVNNVPSTVNVDVARATVQGAGPHFVTFYAHVSTGGVLPPGPALQYGGQICPQIGAGSHATGGWECDPNAWYTLEDGSLDPAQFTFPHARLGDLYQLRDVDCDDGQIVAGVPVFAGDGGISATNCDSS